MRSVVWFSYSRLRWSRVPPPLNLTGDTIGEWYVIRKLRRHASRQGGTWFLCRCSCGTVKANRGGALSSGGLKHCSRKIHWSGPKKFVDHTGKQFGHWTILKWVPRKKKGTWYLARCSCGTEKVVYAHSLVAGESRSCGCQNGLWYLRSLELGIDQNFVLTEYNRYRTHARHTYKRKKGFHLSVLVFRELILRPCFYCDSLPLRVATPKSYRAPEGLVNGVDRVNNRRGYWTDNCVPCCTRCNSAKSDSTLEEFAAYMQHIRNTERVRAGVLPYADPLFVLKEWRAQHIPLVTALNALNA